MPVNCSGYEGRLLNCAMRWLHGEPAILIVHVQVMLTGVPLRAGLFTITGCLVTAMGVSWRQPWLPRSAFSGQISGQQDGTKVLGGHPQVIQLSLYAHPPLLRCGATRRNATQHNTTQHKFAGC